MACVIYQFLDVLQHVLNVPAHVFIDKGNVFNVFYNTLYVVCTFVVSVYNMCNIQCGS